MDSALRPRTRRRRFATVALIAAAWLLCRIPSPSSGSPIPLLRIGLSTSAARIGLSAEQGLQFRVHRRPLSPTTAAAGSTWRVEATLRGWTLRDDLGRSRGTCAETLLVTPLDPETGPVSVDGKCYRGELLIWKTGDALTVVNVVDLESYLRGVVPLELGMGGANAVEALKAQSVAARSYTLATIGRWRDRGFDLYGSVEDQAYGGVDAERPHVSEAVAETMGEVAFFEDSPIRAFYCSTCGGQTSGPEEAWGDAALPYLIGIQDRGRGEARAFCSDSPRFHWSEEWTGSQFDAMLDGSLPRLRPGWSRARCGRLMDAEIRTRFDSDRVSCFRLRFERDHVDLVGDEIRWALRTAGKGGGLPSCLLREVRCRVRKGRLVSVVIDGQGYGHGVGMCQFGAVGMSKAGHGHREILSFYYRGIDVRRCY